MALKGLENRSFARTVWQVAGLGWVVSVLVGCAGQSSPQWQTVSESSVPQAVIAESQRQGKLRNSETVPSPVMSSEGDVVDRADLLGAGFVIRMQATVDRSLSGEFTVSDDGVLKLPYGYVVEVSGRTLSAVEQQAREHYAPFYRGSPELRMSVVRRKLSVMVRGLVEKPGRFAVRSDSSLDELIGSAGGLQKASDQAPLARFVRITGAHGTKIIRLSDYYAGTLLQIPAWEGGESVFFQRDAMSPGGASLAAGAAGPGSYIQILGQVRSPGEYSLSQEGDFFYYLTEAGGFTDRADLHNLMLVRSEKMPDGRQQRKVLTFSIDQAREVPPFSEGDILLVHADNPTSTEKKTHILSEIGQFLGSIATGALVFVAL